MTGKTHLVFGLALALAALEPRGVPAVCGAVAGAAIGSVIADIDMQAAGNRAERKVILPAALGVTVLAFIVDAFLGGALRDTLIAQADALDFVCLALFLGACLAGAIAGHRSFMHSLTALGLLGGLCALFAPPLAPAFAIGYGSHLLLDLTNKKGLPLLFPFKRRQCLKWFKSDGIADKLTLGLSAAALAVWFALTAR